MKNVEVTACKDCPFYTYNVGYYMEPSCYFTSENIPVDQTIGYSCPLRKQDIYVTFKTKKEENKNG